MMPYLLLHLHLECGRSDVYDNWGRYSSTEGTGVADTAASNRLALQ